MCRTDRRCSASVQTFDVDNTIGTEQRARRNVIFLGVVLPCLKVSDDTCRRGSNVKVGHVNAVAAIDRVVALPAKNASAPASPRIMSLPPLP